MGHLETYIRFRGARTHRWRRTGAAVITTGAALLLTSGFATAAPLYQQSARSVAVPGLSRAYAGTTITVLMPPYAQMPQSQLAKFTNATGIKVQQESLAFSDLHTRVVTAELAGKAPADVTDVDWSWVGQFGSRGWYANLDGLVPKSVIKGSSVSPDFVYSGQQIAIPYDVDLRGSIVNMTLLRKAGITSPPKTWTQLTNDAKLLKQKAVSEYPVSVRLSATEGTSTAWYALTMGAGGTIAKGNSPTFTSVSSAAGKALSLLVELYKDGLIPPGAITQQQPQDNTGYEDGQNAILLAASPGLMGSLHTYPAIAHDDSVFEAMPSPTGKNEGTLTLPDGFGIPTQVTGKTRDASAMFLEWWEQPQQQMLDYSDPNLGNLPSQTSDLNQLVKAGKVQSSVLSALASARPLFPGGTPTWYPQFSDDASSMIQAVVEGHESVGAGLSKLASELRALAA